MYIYAYLNKDGEKVYTQLFDSSYATGYETKTYNFTTLNPGDIFHSYEVSYRPIPNGLYGDREMNTKINLIAYQNSVPFNYDISYAFCSFGDSTCGVQTGSTSIFRSTVLKNNLLTTFIDTVNISRYDLEFGTSYYIYIYAVFDYYDYTTGENTKIYLQLNRRNIVTNFRNLIEPEFVVGRSADYINGDYVIDFSINVSDSDKTLVGGKYFVKLLDEDGNLAGDLQIKDDDGNYVTVGSNGSYANYEFDASVRNKSIRIKGLNENSKYTIVVYGNAYLNNYSDTIPKSERTIYISRTHSVYTTNSYGVTFGGKVTFTATERSFIVTFDGGSKFDNVINAVYTTWQLNTENATVLAGEYDLINGTNKFEVYGSDGEWRFIITPDEPHIEGKQYNIHVVFTVLEPDSNETRDYEFQDDPYYFEDEANGNRGGRG